VILRASILAALALAAVGLVLVLMVDAQLDEAIRIDIT
jgi:hypothetical protein